MPDTSVTIVGASGDLGFGLALRLARAGVTITIGSRDAARAEETAERIRQAVPIGSAKGLPNEEAVAANEIVFLSVPFASQAQTCLTIRGHLQPGALVVDATVPLAASVGGKPTRTVGVWQGSAAQQAQELLPDVPVVSALHSVSAANLQDLGHRLDEDVLICGRRREDKRRAARVLDRVDGLRCVDAGPLEMARIAEQLTALMIGINGRYKTHAGIKVTGLPDADLFPPLQK